MGMIPIDQLKDFYHGEAFIVTFSIFLLVLFAGAMVTNSARFRNWFNEVQEERLCLTEEGNARPIHVDLILAMVMMAPLTISFGGLILMARLGMSGHIVFLMTMGIGLFVFVAQRLYAVKFR